MFDTDLYATYALSRSVDALKDRSPEPMVYNIETTSQCNMRCKMCPRTKLMRRKPTTMSMHTFELVVDQLRQQEPGSVQRWQQFCAEYYGVPAYGPPSENHFFLHVIPHVIQLHGYGDPLLDPHLVERVQYLTDAGLRSYFSCNPNNIDVGVMREAMQAGLGVVKYSIESTDDETCRQVRGPKANFTQSYKKIVELLDARAKDRSRTMVVITMLDLGRPGMQDEYRRLAYAFHGLPVYLYIKSEDTQWLRGDGGHGTQSIHWSEPCLHPWASMTVLADGTVGACMETYDDDEFALGNVNDAPLADIWNGAAYERLRRAHLGGSFDGVSTKCTERCDMRRVA